MQPCRHRLRSPVEGTSSPAFIILKPSRHVSAVCSLDSLFFLRIDAVNLGTSTRDILLCIVCIGACILRIGAKLNAKINAERKEGRRILKDSFINEKRLVL